MYGIKNNSFTFQVYDFILMTSNPDISYNSTYAVDLLKRSGAARDFLEDGGLEGILSAMLNWSCRGGEVIDKCGV